MEINDALAADLDLLTAALDDPGIDIADTVRQIAGDARLAVRSYLGLSISVAHGDQVFDLTVLHDVTAGTAVGSSIRMPLRPDPASAEPAAVMTLYAAQPGAFVDLAADLAWLTGGDFVLDEHLAMPPPTDVSATLRGATAISQAIGVLIARGHAPEQARDELARLAHAAGSDVYSAATDVLRVT